MRRLLSMLIVVCVILTALPAASFSQSTGAALAGVVRNQRSEAVPGATVTATNAGTNQSRSTITDNDGQYRLPSLAVGDYDISVQADTYSKALRKLTLRVNEEARVDFELAVPGSAETMTVVGSSAPITETSNSVLGIVIENKQMNDLPLNGRNFLQDVAGGVPGIGGGGPRVVQLALKFVY